MNMLQIISMVASGGNPQQIIPQMLGQNRIFQRAMEMVEGKTPQEIEQIAKNICEQQGINFENAINQMQRFGLNLPRHF